MYPRDMIFKQFAKFMKKVLKLGKCRPPDEVIVLGIVEMSIS